MNPQSNEFDQVSVNYVSSPADDAWKQAETLAADSRYSDGHKREQINGFFEEARREIDTRLEGELKRLTESNAALEKAIRGELLPSAEDVTRLNYAREMLAAQAKRLKPDGLFAQWEQAIADGDKIAARAFSDFLPALIPAEQLQRYERLREQTADFLLTTEQRKAREKLAYNRATEAKMRVSAGMAKAKLVTGWKIGRDGKIIDGGQVKRMNQMRNSF